MSKEEIIENYSAINVSNPKYAFIEGLSLLHVNISSNDVERVLDLKIVEWIEKLITDKNNNTFIKWAGRIKPKQR